MQSKQFRDVRPARPAAGYIGGKKQLAALIIERIEATPHELYAEPFVGMGGVFLRRTRAPKSEVINDRSGDVANFFRVLQRHYDPFMDMLRWQLAGRREFERLKASDPATLTDLERAARFLYLQRLAFGGKVAGRNFGTTTTGPARFDVRKLAPILEAIHERLAGVVIECLPWADFIGRYDRPHTLFYLDPPYWGSEDDYGRGLFGREEYAAVADALRGLQGRFILTINDRPETRKAFAGFARRSVGLSYTIAGGEHRRPARELFITGPRRAQTVRLTNARPAG
ncbi:MAG: DNA adenine methylase [Xanthobacteraceae bacterium]